MKNITTKTRTGVMIVKDGKGWGNIYTSGHSSSDGWVSLDKAYISDPKYLKTPSDATYKGSHYIDELNKGKIVEVVRTTSVKVVIK